MSGKERGAAAPRGPRARAVVGRIRDGEAILRRRRRIRGGEAPQFGLLTWEVSNMQPLHLDPNEHRALFTKLLGSKPIAAQGHLGTHLDCCTKALEARVRELDAFVMDCRRGMPGAEDFRGLPSLQGMALLLHTGNHERNGYGNAAYFARKPSSRRRRSKRFSRSIRPSSSSTRTDSEKAGPCMPASTSGARPKAVM